MQQKVKIPIKMKIITKNDIVDICKYVFSLKKNESDYFYLNITFNNEYEISSEDLSCIDNRKVEEYVISTIHIYYHDRDYNERVNIMIYNIDQYEHSFVEIENNNDEKLGSVVHRIEELFGFCDNQNKIAFLVKTFFYQYILPILLACISSIYINWIIYKVTADKDLISMLFTVTILIVGTIYKGLLDRLEKLFPSIEIVINDKTNNIKKAKERLIQVLLVFILPIGINIIYDFLKTVIN